jgi:hypothetical protein
MGEHRFIPRRASAFRLRHSAGVGVDLNGPACIPNASGSGAVNTFVDVPADPAERHRDAVRRSLGWAQESADHGDYADALGWISVLEAIGEQFSSAYQAKRQAWGAQLVANRGRL